MVDKILEEAGETFRRKNKEYGAAYLRLGEELFVMFPDGVKLSSPEDFLRFRVFSSVVAKLNRYAANFSEGGHQDSIHDAMVYAAMLEKIDNEI